MDSPSSSVSNGSDHIGHESAFYEKFILDDLDSYWDELNDRLSVSRMVNDSVIRGMVNAVVQEAADTIASREAEITLLKEKLRSCELSVSACNKIEPPIHLKMDAGKEKAISEWCKNYPSANGCLRCSNHVKWIRSEVDEQIQHLKEFFHDIKSPCCVCNENADVRSCSIFAEAKGKKFLEIDERFDALKDKLVAGLEQISGMICSTREYMLELQWEHELQGEITDMVIGDFIRDLHDVYETRLSEQKTLIKTLNENWQEKVAKISKIREELNTISEEINSHDNLEWNVSRRKESLAGKTFANHNIKSHFDENGSMTVETSIDAGEDVLDIADLPQLKHMTKEELITHCKNEMTKMRRLHDSALQEKTEELFRLKREILKEKGSLPFRKEKENEHIKKKLTEFILNLDEIVFEKEISHRICNIDDNLHSFKDRINSLLVDNKRLRNLLSKKKEELSFMSSQVSQAESKLSSHSAMEATHLMQIRNLQWDVENMKIEADLKSSLCGIFVTELIGEHRHMMKDMIEHVEIEVQHMQGIYSTVFREVVHNALSWVNPAIIKYHAEKVAFKELLDKRELELTLKSEENEKLEQAVRSMVASVKEKETLASETGTTVERQKQQLNLVHHKLDMLREKLNEQEEHISSLRSDLHTTNTRLNDALQKIHHYELEMVKLNEQNRIDSDALEDAEKQKLLLHSIIQEKEITLLSSFHRDTEQLKQFECIIASMHELSKAFVGLEKRLTQSSKRNISRLKVLAYQLNMLLQQASQQTDKCLWYKQLLEIRYSNLQMAEAEVDILGDEVDALLGLLGRIYLALDHYSPVLQHYPGVMEILKLVQRELNGENN